MRGIQAFNFPAFLEAAAELRRKGYEVFNPAENDIYKHPEIDWFSLSGDEDDLLESTDFSLRVALGEDLAFICKHADAIAVLPGWENSKGATAEMATAKALGLEIIYI